MTKVLIDTNVLVYFTLNTDIEKHNLAFTKISELINSDICFVSVQNIVEFSRVLLEKSIPKVNSTFVNDSIFRILKKMQVIKYNPETIIRANILSEIYKIHFFDALLVATMQENGITAILTENVSDFKKIPGLEVICL